MHSAISPPHLLAGTAKGMGLPIVTAILGIVCSPSLAQSVPPPAGQISADCTTPVYATDWLVCTDGTLRALDAEMLGLWSRAGAERRLDDDAQADQEDWFRQRSLCAFRADHRACAIAAYRARIQSLGTMLTSP